MRAGVFLCYYHVVMNGRSVLRLSLALLWLLTGLSSGAGAVENDPIRALAERYDLAANSRIYGKVAPDFELKGPDGRSISLGRNLHGKVVVLYIFVNG
jgi:hypothetical protein